MAKTQRPGLTINDYQNVSSSSFLSLHIQLRLSGCLVSLYLAPGCGRKEKPLPLRCQAWPGAGHSFRLLGVTRRLSCNCKRQDPRIPSETETPGPVGWLSAWLSSRDSALQGSGGLRSGRLPGAETGLGVKGEQGSWGTTIHRKPQQTHERGGSTVEGPKGSLGL